MLHRTGSDDGLLLFANLEPTAEALRPRGRREIGVVYRPQNEAFGKYVPSVLPRRDDAFLYIDTTDTLHPLPAVHAVPERELPETYPTGI